MLIKNTLFYGVTEASFRALQTFPQNEYNYMSVATLPYVNNNNMRTCSELQKCFQNMKSTIKPTRKMESFGEEHTLDLA